MKPVHKRHQLKEDALVTGAFRFWTYVQRNYKKILYGLGALGVILIIVFAVFQINRTREQNSLQALSQARLLFQEAKYEQAIPELEAVIKNYGGTQAAKEARYYKANALFQLERYEDAIPAFEKAYKKGDAITKPSALKGMGDCYMQLDKYAEAAEEYMQVADNFSDAWVVLPSLMKAGLCYQKTGEIEKAKDVYQRVVDNYEESTYIDKAKAHLYILKKTGSDGQ
jgi:tetratricopeptide (TPR) repeat protein